MALSHPRRKGTQKKRSLAALVPSLQSVESSKLSKHLVVDETILFLQTVNRKAAESQMLIDSLLTERHQLLAEMSLWRASAGIETCVFPAPVSDAGHGADITRGAVAATEATGVTGSLGSLDLLGRENDVAALDTFAVSDITSMLDVRTAWSGTLSLENDALIP
ncbi:hypothetical protein ED733_000053, partial [Metarhizium rileyi]